MSDLFNNGLKRTPRGQEEQISSNLDLTLSGKNIKQVTIEDCIVLNVSGVDSFQSYNYLPTDIGSVMVDVLLPEGKTIFENGVAVRVARNIRVRGDGESLTALIGTLKEDFLFDSEGNPRMGDLTIKNYNSNNVTFNGEFVFKKCTKKFGSRRGYRQSKASLLGERISPSFNVLHGTLDKDAAIKYREMYIQQIKQGDYYG